MDVDDRVCIGELLQLDFHTHARLLSAQWCDVSSLHADIAHAHLVELAADRSDGELGRIARDRR